MEDRQQKVRIVTARGIMQRITLLAVLLALFVAGATMLGAPVAHAAGTVTDCSKYGPGAGTLQEALAGGGTVTFSCNGTIVVPEIVINDDTVLDGAGQNVTLSGGDINRVLRVESGKSLTVRRLTITNGRADRGAGIYTNGANGLTVERSVILSNTSTQSGGGVYARATTSLRIIDSTFRGNSANSGGGLLIAEPVGPVGIQGSTFVINRATGASPVGAGLALFLDTACQNVGVNVVNTTFTTNVAESNAGRGGAIFVQGQNFNAACNQVTLNLTHNTFVDNAAVAGAGLQFNLPNPPNASRVNIANSIFANTRSAECNTTVPGTYLVSKGYNVAKDDSCNLTQATDQKSVTDVDKQIAALADNGGPTQTRALLPGSVALDKIPVVNGSCNDTGVVTDQRGFDRPAPGNANCDVGAHENGAVGPSSDLGVTISASKSTALRGEALQFTVTVNNSDGNDAGNIVVLLPSSGFTYGNWTCTASAGSTCPATGSGSPLTISDLLKNGTATFTVDATVSPTASEGPLEAVAQLVAEIGDTNAANNRASTVITVPKTLDLSASTAITWTEGTPAQVVAANLVINRPGDLGGAIVAINAGYEQGADRLTVGTSTALNGTVNGLNWVWEGAKGELRLTGTANAATYQAVLRQVTFVSSTADPNPAARTVRFSLGHGRQFAGNGHFYDVSNVPIIWSDARRGAEQRNYYGMQGYLATITSRAENDFIAKLISGQGLWWLGGSDSTSEGAWNWVTGPEGQSSQQFWNGGTNGVQVGFSNWNPNQPSGTNIPAAGDSDYLATDQNGGWDDQPIATSLGRGYVAEFGGMPNEGMSTLAGDVTVNVIVVNNDPTDIALAPAAIAELAPAGTVVGTLSATDVDGGPSYTYSLVAGAGGDDNAAFTIQGTQLRSAQIFDFETKSSYSIRVRVNDGKGGTFEKALTIAITNVDVAPTFVTTPAPPAGTYGAPYSFAVVAHGEPATITYGASGLPPGITIDPASGQLSGVPTQVGTFLVTVTASNGITPNASKQGSITINKALLLARADDKFIKQNGAVPPLTVSYTGFVLGDDAGDLDTPPNLTTTSDTSNTGLFPITASNTPADTNYTIQFLPGVLTIDAKDIPTITWPQPSSIVYGTPLDVTQLNATASVAGTFVYSPSKGTVLNAGAGQLLQVTFTPFDAANFATVSLNNQIAVTRAPLTITANNQAAFLGDPPKVYTAQYAGFVNGDGPNDLDAPVQFATNVPASPASGTYDIIPFSASDANYAITFVKGTLTLALRPQAPIIGDFPPPDGEYGAPYHHVLSAFSNAGDVTFSLEAGSVLPPGLTFTPDPASNSATIEGTPTQAGTFGPFVVKATNSAGSTTSQTVSITVRKAVLIVTADDRTIREGTAPEPPALTGRVTGLRLGDTAAVLSPAPDFGTTATAASPLGSYAITLDNSPAAANYLILSVKGTLTIVDKDVPVITWPAPATIVYGTPLGGTQLNAQATESGSATAVPGTFIYNPAAGTVLPAGNGQILQTAFTPDSDGFTPVLASTQISVTRAPLQITAENKSITAGEPVPTLTVTYAGFVNGEGPSDLDHVAVASSTGNPKQAGTYPIIVSGAQSGNYAINYVQGTLTVALGCTVEGSSTGAPGSTFPYVAAGFASGEMVEVAVDGKTIGTVAADADGVVKAALYLDPDAPLGAHTVTNSGPTGSVACNVTLDANAALRLDTADRTTVVGRPVGTDSTVPYVLRGCAADELVLVTAFGLLTDAALADSSGNLDGRMFVGDVPATPQVFDLGAFCATQEHHVLLLTEPGAPKQAAPGNGVVVEPLPTGPDSYVPFTPCGFTPGEVVDVKVDGNLVGVLTADGNGCLDGYIHFGPGTTTDIHSITAGPAQMQVAIVPDGLQRPNPGGKTVLSNVNPVGGGGSKFPVTGTGLTPGAQATVLVGPHPTQQKPVGTVTVDPTGTATVVIDPVDTDSGVIYITLKADNGGTSTSTITVDPQGPQIHGQPGAQVVKTKPDLYLPILAKESTATASQ